MGLASFSSIFQSCHFVHPQVQDLREVLNEEWVWFQQVLIDSDIMLQKHKEKFKNSLILSSEEFKKKIQTIVQEFNSTGHTLCCTTHRSLSVAHSYTLSQSVLSPWCVHLTVAVSASFCSYCAITDLYEASSEPIIFANTVQ